MVGRRAQHARVGAEVSTTKRCNHCLKDLDKSMFRKYRGRPINRCNPCRKVADNATVQRNNYVESSLNLTCDAWKGRVNRKKSLTPTL